LILLISASLRLMVKKAYDINLHQQTKSASDFTAGEVSNFSKNDWVEKPS